MNKALLIIFALISLTFPCYSEDLSELLQLLENNVFSVNVIGRIYNSGRVSAWEAEVAKYTISGRKVSVRMEGNELIVIAEITPYIDDENEVLLEAQGQVWLNISGQTPVKYTSAMKSLPIKPGDRVYFYPLGVSSDYNSEMFILELEIQILPYKTIAQSD